MYDSDLGVAVGGEPHHDDRNHDADHGFEIEQQAHNGDDDAAHYLTVIVTFQRAIEWQLTPPGAADGQLRCELLTIEVPGAVAVNAARTLADPVASGVDAASVSAVPVLSNGSQPCAWSGVAVMVTVPPTATQRVRELSVDGTTRLFGQPEPPDGEPAVPDPGGDGDGDGDVTMGGADAPGDDPVDPAVLQAASPPRARPASAIQPARRRAVMARDFI